MVIAARRFTALSALALGLFCACAQEERPITQLILVADTDMTDVDSVQFEIAEPGTPTRELAQSAHSATSGPSYVSVVRDEGSLGPLTVTARGLRRGMVQIERTQRVSFVLNQTRVVLLHLLASCLKPPRCPMEQTCTEFGCMSPELEEAQLLTWTGSAPALFAETPLDAGAGDARVATDADVPIYRMCGDAGNVDIQSNLSHCGACDKPCGTHPAANHRDTACVASACSYTCAPGFGDCDGKPVMNGCEIDLSIDENHCGACGNVCKGAMSQCVAGVCQKP